MRGSIVLVACLASCAAVAGCEPRESADRGSYPSPVSASVAAKLVAQAPTIGKMSFGPGVDVSIFRPSWLFSEARVVDETLYVTYYTQQSAQQQIASVSRGVLHPVLLSPDYWTVSFENDNRLIAAKGSGDVRVWYLLRGGRAIAVPRPASPVYGIPHHVLADGDSCADGMAGSGRPSTTSGCTIASASSLTRRCLTRPTVRSRKPSASIATTSMGRTMRRWTILELSFGSMDRVRRSSLRVGSKRRAIGTS
jgi:hypothetical protein